MRVLITGGAGFLGSHLCDAMLAGGHSVVCADNLLTGRMGNLAHLVNEPRFEFLQQDVCQPFDPGEIDCVFHFASPASPVDYLQHGIETLRVGSAGTINCLETAKKYNAKFLLASTSECYGDPLEHPQKESYWGHVNSIGPRSVYDEAKRFAEAATMAYHRYHEVDTHIVRIFNTYGPRLQIDDGRVISNFMKQGLRGEDLTVYGDGLQTRSFCYVSDEIAGIVALSKSDEHYPVNIGNPNELTMLECAKVVLEVTGSTSKICFDPLPQDDPRQRRPDITKARALLGWEPKIDLLTGLRLSLEYFRTAVLANSSSPRRSGVESRKMRLIEATVSSMDTQAEFDELRRDSESWWYITRGKLLREAAMQAVHEKRDAWVLDLGCTAQLQFDDFASHRVCNVHSSSQSLAFRQIQGDENLVCSRAEELAFGSNSFDAIIAGDVLQSVADDVSALREIRRVLKEGGLLCLTVPAYSFLWGEDDEARGHQRRYTASELRRKLNTCGFQIQRASYFVASAFLPLAVGKVARDIFHKSVTHHRHYPRPSRLANAAMVGLLECERHLMHYINLPFGSRLVCWAQKPPLVAETVSVPAWERKWTQHPLAQGSG